MQQTLGRLIKKRYFCSQVMKSTPLLPTIIGTGFGVGFWPWGPGTAGALLATLLWFAASQLVSPTLLPFVTLGATVVFTALGTWATARLRPFWGDDPSRIVVDEMVGVWMPLAVTPAGSLWLAVLSFALFRFFDILKPLGIRALDRQKGAFFVMADDLLAGIYSLFIVLIVRWLL